MQAGFGRNTLLHGVGFAPGGFDVTASPEQVGGAQAAPPRDQPVVVAVGFGVGQHETGFLATALPTHRLGEDQRGRQATTTIECEPREFLAQLHVRHRQRVPRGFGDHVEVGLHVAVQHELRQSDPALQMGQPQVSAPGPLMLLQRSRQFAVELAGAHHAGVAGRRFAEHRVGQLCHGVRSVGHQPDQAAALQGRHRLGITDVTQYVPVE
ncbi:hypothetical protein MOKP118_12000 [Mycobacterium avium subsp. hominissuis]